MSLERDVLACETPAGKSASAQYGFAAPHLDLTPHRYRGLVLDEVHARPFHAIDTPARILHFAYLTDASEREADRAALSETCALLGCPVPVPGARHHRVQRAGAALSWEQHNEFTTYSWLVPPDPRPDIDPLATGPLAPAWERLPQPGSHLASVELLLVEAGQQPDIDAVFAAESLCAMSAEDGRATIATDFMAGANGFVRILVVNDGMSPIRAGALVQRLLELETYRLIALLGLPEAQRVAVSVHGIESSFVALTREMTGARTLEDDERLLERLAILSAELEAGAAEMLFRLGASRAYNNIVQGRLLAIGAEPIPERETFGAFLSRRMAPALQTCASLEERQANLSRKLARATQLLRTSVDVGMERQNREILSTMSERTRLQLRLQQTVEGLSIAALSYYVIGLLGHAFVALPRIWPEAEPEVATAVATPLVVAVVALVVVRRLRAHAHAHPARRDPASHEKKG